MNLLSILAEKNAIGIQEKIQSILESFYDEGINIEEKTYYVEPFYYLNYSVPIKSIKDYPIDDFINIFKFCVANALYEYIRDCEEPNLIQHIISTNYCCFDIRERMEIYRNCLDILNKKNIDRFFSEDDTPDLRPIVLQQLGDHLENNTEINLSGFILFRLKDYLLDLDETIEKAVENFLIDREYNEFIKLLKYFVDIQEPKFDTVHIIFDEEAGFKIYDQHNKLLDNDHIKNVAVEFLEDDINQGDLLISALITIAPKRIIAHGLSKLKDTGIIDSLQNIFSERVHLCDGCKWCNVRKNANKE